MLTKYLTLLETISHAPGGLESFFGTSWHDTDPTVVALLLTHKMIEPDIESYRFTSAGKCFYLATKALYDFLKDAQ